MSDQKEPVNSTQESDETLPLEDESRDVSADDADPAEDPPASGEETVDPLQAALAERDENWNRYLRSQAELENYRKRAQRERDEERKYAVLPVVREILPIIDNLQRAVDAGKQSESADESSSLLTGVSMVLQQFEETLGRFQVQPIPAVGEPFDPNRHEALQQIPTADHPPMTVLQEVERGYILHDRVVRPSKVLVSAALPNEGS